jgi:hypothetical protein
MKTSSLFILRLPSLLAVASVVIVGSMSAGCQAKQSKAQEQKSEQAVTSASPSPDGQKAATSSDTTTPDVSAQTKLIVFYFHGHQRCPTCYKLENYAKSEVEIAFADAIKKGEVEWKTVNIEKPGNEHYNNDYKLYTKSVIVSMIKDGKESSWKNLDQIWQLVHDESTYREYIRKEVKACLKGKCL